MAASSFLSNSVQAVTGAGTTTADATVVSQGSGNITTLDISGASNSGVRLSAGSQKGSMVVYNVSGANTVKLYPPTGGTLNGAAADAAVSVVTLKGGVLVCTSTDGLTWAGAVGA